MDDDHLTLDDWKEIARHGGPLPEDVKQLLQEFCSRVDSHRGQLGLSNWVNEYVADAFNSYLQGNAPSVDKALGLVRSRGRQSSKKTTNQNIEIATRALRLMISGEAESPEHAGELLSSQFSPDSGIYDLAETTIRDIYFKHHIDAMAVLVGEGLDFQ